MRFVRSKHFKSFMDKNISATRPESLRVAVVGVTEQREAKSDVRIFRDEQLVWSWSLKKDNRQLSQVGGKTAKNVFGYLAGIFGFSISGEFEERYEDLLSNLDKGKYYDLSHEMFGVISRRAEESLSSDNDGYSRQIVGALKKAAISDEYNIDLLNFEKARFRLLGFSNILDLFVNVNLCSGIYRTARGNVPYLVVYGADNDNSACPTSQGDSRILFTLRPKWEAGPPPVLRYYLEYGNLMDRHLTRVAQ